MIIDHLLLREKFVEKYLEQLSAKTLRNKESLLIEGLFCTDFKSRVSILHEDGSTCHYKYAFFVEDEAYYAVFTEHCGYHEFKKEWLEKIEELAD